MLQSMTGFGEAEQAIPGGRLRVQIKTVNHRFFNLSLRVPSEFERYESQLRDWIRAPLARGHVTFSLSLELDPDTQAAAALEIDHTRARRYRDLLLELKDQLALAGDVDLKLVAGCQDLFRTPTKTSESIAVVDLDTLRAITAEAAQAAATMRAAEGERLAADLRERLRDVEIGVAQIEERAPDRLRAERDRLREAVARLLESEEVDDDRLAREIAYLAERWDINEEIVRLRSHMALFRELLDSDSPEPVGKRLAFLVQELHREANTIGSKANDDAIAHAALAVKEQIERMREQVENIA